MSNTLVLIGLRPNAYWINQSNAAITIGCLKIPHLEQCFPPINNANLYSDLPPNYALIW